MVKWWILSREVGSISSISPTYLTVREAFFYESLRGGKVRCTLCERRCEVVDGNFGYCGTRRNIGGKLYTLVYGDLSAIESRPIEIKPFNHYWPGSYALTFSTWSCNFSCPWCQNYHLSRALPKPEKAKFYPPEKIVEWALENGDVGLCASFQEPTLLTEWAIQVFTIGKRMGIRYCCYVSNGYMTVEALKALHESGMDGLKIDIKGGPEVYEKYCGGVNVDKVWRNVVEAKKLGLHIEIVNLLVTGVNDHDESIEWVIEKHLENAGPEVPLHFTRYYPAYKFHNPPTKIEVLEKAYYMARKAGILYPYIGNVPGHRYESTYCPNCGDLLIKRYGHYILKYRVTPEKRCPTCGNSILVTGYYMGDKIQKNIGA